MADHALVEAEEQVDLDGDNDIEEMMDDEAEDAMEDDGYRRRRHGYMEGAHGFEGEGHGSEGEDHGFGGDGHGSEGESQDKISASDVDNDASSSMKNEEQTKRPKGEDDSQKHAELLALPPHGSEVFIGGIPRDATEEDLRGLCEPFGEIFEVRLMKDKDKKENKGYAFITYTSKDAAQKAVEEIHDKEFKGKTLRCSLSQAKHRLFIGNVPKSMSEEDMKKILEESGPGVENIEFLKDPHNPSRNRGFVFVEYYNHACADYSRQKMSGPNFKLDATKPTVSWAEPKNSTDSSAASQVKAIYVKNLPENVTSEKLKELFEHHGEITKVVLPPPKAGQTRDFGFIHFAERSSALKAIKGIEKYEIDGHVIEATLAKPQGDRKIDYAPNSAKPGLLPNYSPYPGYGYTGDPYGAYSAGYGAAGFGQPMIYGRGPTPPGMRMVPMMLPDGRLGYVLQQPGAQSSQPPPPPRRSDRGGGPSESGGRSSEGNRGRRYRPY
uniref:Heterogeneous nuclear ribonucleoprotein Q n=1 Tax=Anthurium amnicola TaxID=1678845 RepID=A0A1D1Y6G9_9ARAE